MDSLAYYLHILLRNFFSLYCRPIKTTLHSRFGLLFLYYLTQPIWPSLSRLLKRGWGWVVHHVVCWVLLLTVSKGCMISTISPAQSPIKQTASGKWQLTCCSLTCSEISKWRPCHKTKPHSLFTYHKRANWYPRLKPLRLLWGTTNPDIYISVFALK